MGDFAQPQQRPQQAQQQPNPLLTMLLQAMIGGGQQGPQMSPAAMAARQQFVMENGADPYGHIPGFWEAQVQAAGQTQPAPIAPEGGWVPYVDTSGFAQHMAINGTWNGDPNQVQGSGPGMLPGRGPGASVTPLDAAPQVRQPRANSMNPIGSFNAMQSPEQRTANLMIPNLSNPWKPRRAG